MLRQFGGYENSWREQDVYIAPREMKTVDFLDTKPNQFVISNPNQAILKVGISNIPRHDNYEGIIEYNTTEIFGRPVPTSQLYILNDSDLGITIKIFSINEPFNIEILKNMNVNLTDYVIESNAEISGVKAGVTLPIRMDEINGGKFTDMQNALNDLVNPSTLEGSTNLYTLLKVLEAIRDKEITLNGDGITLNGVATDMTGTINKLEEIRTIVNKLDCKTTDTILAGIEETMSEIHSLCDYNVQSKIEKGMTPVYLNNVNTFEHTANGDYILHFDWLFNDGGNTNVLINDVSVFTMYEGESFSEMNFKLAHSDVIKFEGENPLYRIKYWKVFEQ